jgi:transcriptional regulator with XRE-family HTH domain
MSTTPQQLLSEFIDDWNAGRRPDVRAFLQRLPAGAERDELADQIGRWLEVAPTPAYDAKARAAIRAEPVVQRLFAAAGQDAGLLPQLLPALRERRRLSVAQLASRLAGTFGLGEPEARRAEGYLERLEAGELEPSRLSRRLVDALADALGVGAGTLADAGAFGRNLRPAAAGGTLFRRDGEGEQWVARDLELLAAAAFEPAPAETLDELDRLFLGGPDA